VELTVAGGGVIDLASRSDLHEHHERMASLLARPSVHFQRITGAVASGTAPLVLKLEAPPGGMLWLPQWVTLTGDDVFGGAIANVTAAVFAGRTPRKAELGIGPPVTGLDLAACLLTGGAGGLSVPNTTAFPDKSPIYPSETVYVILTGTGTAAGATKYTATIGVLELPFTDEALTW
jgi:hypothetical protein